MNSAIDDYPWSRKYRAELGLEYTVISDPEPQKENRVRQELDTMGGMRHLDICLLKYTTDSRGALN